MEKNIEIALTIWSGFQSPSYSLKFFQKHSNVNSVITNRVWQMPHELSDFGKSLFIL